MRNVIVILMCMVLLVSAEEKIQKEKPLKFATWEIFEADKLASIWLIKRFIDSTAIIDIVPRNTVIKDAVSFDTPEGKFKRTYNKCTFQEMVTFYKVQNKKVDAIGLLVYDIEINKWSRKMFRRTQKLEESIVGIIKKGPSSKEIVEKALMLFDALYADIPEKPVRN